MIRKSILASVLFVGLLAASFTHASSDPTPAGTGAAVVQAVTAAIKAKELKGETVPPLATFPITQPWLAYGGAMLKPSCDPVTNSSDAKHPVPCMFGDTKASRTIVLFGDSFAGSWLPAMNIAADHLKYRLAVFGYAGCITPFVSAVVGPGVTESDVKLCDDWHGALPAAIRKLHPIAILAANGSPSWGTTKDKGWVTGMKTAFDEMTVGAPNTLRVIIGTGPHLPSSGPACAAAYPDDIQKCTYKYNVKSGSQAAALARDVAGAKAANATLIPTIQWVCAAGSCPVVVDHILVYADEDHLTTQYSEWLSEVVTASLKSALNH